MIREHGHLPRLALLLLLAEASALADAEGILDRPWVETRTAHFHTYSCGPTQEVARLAGRLEQFHQAYAVLAGTNAVASPPVVVMAFPDHDSLKPFLPVYGSQPGNLAGFFCRGTDENLIVLPLAGTRVGSLEIIFHEYSHLLFRRNERIWPMWLKEGMADIYATFEVAGEQGVRIAKPMDAYLKLLKNQPMMPLERLFGATRESPEYNERARQGMFYAQSWLLTHYLMVGNPAHKARLGQLTVCLRIGQTATQAFTNAFGLSLPAMEVELRDYLNRGRFEPLFLRVDANLRAPRVLTRRPMQPAEVCFRLGDQLMRIGRLEEAESWFARTRSLAASSPLGFEGLGLLAGERDQHELATRYLREAFSRKTSSFLAHYVFARERLRLTMPSPDTVGRLEKTETQEIRHHLQTALALMPDFGPAHHLLGLFDLTQGGDLEPAAEHLEKAARLEPENPAYQFSLARVQFARQDLPAARRTLEALCRPYVPASLRAQAEELLQRIQ
jgi:tetratricopeptide (TPR) repeat protein